MYNSHSLIYITKTAATTPRAIEPATLILLKTTPLLVGEGASAVGAEAGVGAAWDSGVDDGGDGGESATGAVEGEALGAVVEVVGAASGEAVLEAVGAASGVAFMVEGAATGGVFNGEGATVGVVVVVLEAVVGAAAVAVGDVAGDDDGDCALEEATKSAAISTTMTDRAIAIAESKKNSKSK